MKLLLLLYYLSDKEDTYYNYMAGLRTLAWWLRQELEEDNALHTLTITQLPQCLRNYEIQEIARITKISEENIFATFNMFYQQGLICHE